ncbi:hypothetical protein B0H19DRAFT_1195792 [Mycena capillaripes]|nr:hypothetical protein B0H19DRAFT_1195792 [Mycena capillaripes]
MSAQDVPSFRQYDARERSVQGPPRKEKRRHAPCNKTRSRLSPPNMRTKTPNAGRNYADNEDRALKGNRRSIAPTSQNARPKNMRKRDRSSSYAN